jgi:lon-related putative ATP-dependent protease
MSLKTSSTGKKLRVKHQILRRQVNPRDLPRSKEYSRHRTHIIGQDRAIASLELGLRLESPGYNVFVSGPSGSGRMTTVKHTLQNFKQPRCPLNDYVYVHNFQEPDRPRLLTLKPGQGLKLKKAMDSLVKNLKRELPRAAATEACQKERDRVIREYQKKEHELVSAFQEKVRKSKFTVVEVQSGPITEHDVLPVIGGEPQHLAAMEEMVEAGKLTRKRLRRLIKVHQQLRTEMEMIQRRTRSLAWEMSSQLEEIYRATGKTVIDSLIEEISRQFGEMTVKDFIEDAREALLERIPALVRREEEDEREEGDSTPQTTEVVADPLAHFQVNVILNNARRKGCPVVLEHNPSVVRLFGTIERSAEESMRSTGIDFMNIRAGALLRATGGFLVVKAEDLITEPGAWKGLKQTLSAGQMEIRPPEGPLAWMQSALKPDPIPLNVKIIMMGDDELYRTLYLMEDAFKKTFKVKAEFDMEMAYSKANLEKIMAFIQRVVTEEDLLQPNRDAIADLIEEAMRDVEDQEKLTTRFRVVADLLREATYWARKAGRRTVTPQDLASAIAQRRKRFNLAEEKYRESIERDVVMVDTRGKRVGQVNGLAVFDLGDYSFGKPCRITASVGVGRSGVVNIERESGLSGSIHDKGVYIVSGFLRERFGQKHPLAMNASVCFEQSYTEIDGDSASSTEVYAILSCLSDLPLRQGVAVTGSVNQRGDIQPIGGINDKIEGFFDICRARGLGGNQGVIIPVGNLPHLMLHQELIDAVKNRKFHVWAVSTIDEGMEILTGVQAGKPDRKGNYPQGTINRRVADRLEQMAEALRGYQ